MKRKTLYLSIIFILSIYILPAQERQAAVQRFVENPGLEHASIGICIKDFSGKEIGSFNKDQSYTPASTLKIVTTATALETLGANYRYKTTLAKDKNQSNKLLIHGYGDPTLGTMYLENDQEAFLTEWSTQIESAFGTTRDLDIVVIDDYFGYEGIAQKWLREDIGNYYASGSYGISIFDNTYQLYLNTLRQDTCPLIVRTNPRMNSIRFRNTLRIDTEGENTGFIVGEPFSNDRLLIGKLPAGRSSISLKGDIPNPGLFLGEIVSQQLKQNNIGVERLSTTFEQYHQQMYSKEKMVYDEEIFYIHQSFPLKDIIRDINVRSNNHYAEHLIRTIGRSNNSDIYSSALDNGIEKTNALWKEHGLDTDALFMHDGCGLAPSNAVSPTFICDVLVYMQNESKNADIFLKSFAKAGKEGTVRNLLKGTRLEGKVYVKSGSIADVQCFAGYYINGEKKYAFTIMVNKYNSPRKQVVKAIEYLLLNVF